MVSIANELEVRSLAKWVKDYVETRQDSLEGNAAWTLAVYDALKGYAISRGWSIYPSEVPKRGEYLLDFMLVDPKYGARVACESQWAFQLNNAKQCREWAFDKLIGVKGDIKLYIHEDTADEFSTTAKEYLGGYALLSPAEAFVDLRWEKDKFLCRWWKPSSEGVQTNIDFEAIELY